MQGVAAKAMEQLWAEVAVFQHLVPLRGTVLSPLVPKVTVPPAAACKDTACVEALEPSVKVAGVLVTAGAAGEVVTLPVSVPVLTTLSAGQGTVDDVQASTVTASGHRLPLPSCWISR